jgi:hypothetical protein
LAGRNELISLSPAFPERLRIFLRSFTAIPQKSATPRANGVFSFKRLCSEPFTQRNTNQLSNKTAKKGLALLWQRSVTTAVIASE